MKRYFSILFIISIFFACGKKETTSPPPTPRYSIKVGDSWLFQSGNTDTTKFVARAETLINNIKFYPLVDTTDTSSRMYVHASDSIILAFPYNNTEHLVISRLIRPNVKQGDSWTDSTIIGNDKIKINTRVDSIDVQESVPAGTFRTTLIRQKYTFYSYEDTSSFMLKFSINEIPIFVRIRAYSSEDDLDVDLRLIKYTKSQ